ncbi:hypothetical protein [Staphylococcus chromogenes]|uniref:hypothetical protein n=1 Tax=Staphylococcus chromogenes TaxID=46126 RepID=UPI0021D076B0|nr:hypothetical protein [Staphylococcus chromogenes]UXS76408.1 hypothetical protein MUA20_05090 [Staphylococcus chromogenes]
MNYEDLYMKYEKYIHYLLKKYYIRYNYDEYFQMLMIRLWELQHQYDYKRSKISMLISALNFTFIF